MKKILLKLIRPIAFFLAIVLCVGLFFSFSFFGTVKSNFKKHGYTLQYEEGKKSTFIQDDNKISYTVYIFRKNPESTKQNIIATSGLTAESVVVWEFSSRADLRKITKHNAEAISVLKNAKRSDHVKGKCLLMTKNPNAVKIFNGESLKK